jgi:hypothetical protein
VSSQGSSIAYMRHFEALIKEIRGQIPLLHFLDDKRLTFRWYEKVENKKYTLKLLPLIFRSILARDINS